MADDVADKAEFVPDFDGVALSGISKEKPTCASYCALAMTRASERQRTTLEQRVGLIRRVMRQIPHPDYVMSMYSPGPETHPKTRDDLFPSEVYAINLEQIAKAAMVFVFLDPPAIGVGQEIELASACGTPTVLLERMKSEKLVRVEPRYMERVPWDSNEESLRSISRMIRGCALGGPMGLVRFSNGYDLHESFSEFWTNCGFKLVSQGVASVETRRRRWREASEMLTRRRRLLGLETKQLAQIIGVHDRLLLSLETEPAVFSALSVANIDLVLAPLGYRVEHPDHDDSTRASTITFGSLPQAKAAFPFDENNHEELKRSHTSLKEFVSSSGSCDLAAADQLWFTERAKLSLPSIRYEGARWVRIVPDREKNSSPSMLFSSTYPVGDRRFRKAKASSRMPQTVEEWRKCWERSRNEHGY